MFVMGSHCGAGFTLAPDRLDCLLFALWGSSPLSLLGPQSLPIPRNAIDCSVGWLQPRSVVATALTTTPLRLHQLDSKSLIIPAFAHVSKASSHPGCCKTIVFGTSSLGGKRFFLEGVEHARLRCEAQALTAWMKGGTSRKRCASMKPKYPSVSSRVFAQWS